MLSSRCIISSLIGETNQVASVWGCPQGGVLSPLLWNLTVDEILWGLNEAGYYSTGFADDIAIIFRANSLRHSLK
jgi:Reverse transcriptase (RNA-dependent DNA polymerase).